MMQQATKMGPGSILSHWVMRRHPVCMGPAAKIYAQRLEKCPFYETTPPP